MGISLPGTVNEKDKILEFAANLNIDNVDFRKYEDLFNFPVYIENESNAAAVAEYRSAYAITRMIWSIFPSMKALVRDCPGTVLQGI